MKRIFTILSAAALTVSLWANEIHLAPAASTAYDTADSARLQYYGYSTVDGVHRWALTLFKNKKEYAYIHTIENPKEGAINGIWPTYGQICYDEPIIRIINGYRDTCQCCNMEGEIHVFFTAISSRNNNVYHIKGYVETSDSWQYSFIDGVWEVYHHGVDNDRPEIDTEVNPTGPIAAKPTDDAVEITWERVANAVAYQLILRLEGEPIYEITIDADGNVESVNRVAAPARCPNVKQSTGYSITIDGLETDKTYTYELHAKDNNGDDLQTLNGGFTTGETTAIDEVEAGVQTKKLIRDGQILIERDGKTYNIIGTMIQ